MLSKWAYDMMFLIMLNFEQTKINYDMSLLFEDYESKAVIEIE